MLCWKQSLLASFQRLGSKISRSFGAAIFTGTPTKIGRHRFWRYGYRLPGAQVDSGLEEVASPAVSGLKRARRVVFQPPTGNLIAAGEPNAWEVFGVVQEALHCT